MKKKEIAKIFHEISDFLEMEETAFKPYAYRRAALSLAALKEDVKEIYEKGGIKALKTIPGIGEGLALKIEEYLKTGKIKYHLELKKKTPVDLQEIINIEGMGPRRAKILYEKLKIRTLKDLEKKARAHKIAPLFGFGKKTEKNILEGIEFLKKSKGRSLLGDILPQVREISDKLKELKEVEKITAVGSVIRMKETIGDVDFLIASSKPQKIMDFFVSLPGVLKVWGKGPTKASVRMEQGFDVDIRVVPKKSYGAALQYFIGSKEHNIALRNIAISKGLKLNEYGLFKGSKMIAGKDEKEIYRILGMPWIPPELRENRGEIKAAMAGKLPKLVALKDIKGDLHCHSNWNGGNNSILEMAETAQVMGYYYLGIADHTKFLKIERGLNEKQLSQQRKEIDKLNKKFQISNLKFHVLQGAETNILNDGSIDIRDDALAKLDYAIAGIHSNFKMPKNQMTNRIITAIKNPNIDIISHPTGRLIKRRKEYQADFDKILRAAQEFKVILEINSSPQRLDLNDQHIRRCKQAGVKMVINTDSHHRNQMEYINLGVGQARRGWAEKEDIINTYPQKKLLRAFK